jgi:homoserine kinase type II
VGGAFVPPPFDPDLWVAFLGDRGVDVGRLGGVEAARGGLINASYRIVVAGSSWMLRWYRQRELPAVASELQLVDRLAATGFPTPSPVAALDGTLVAPVLGWPAALFPFVTGEHPDAGEHNAWLRESALGAEVAEAMGRLGTTTLGWRLSGERHLEPASRVDAYVRRIRGDDQLLGVEGMPELLDSMSNALDAFRAVAPRDLPPGVVHNDVHAANVLVDPDDHLLSILDFDDARNAPLMYELVALFPYWARSSIDSLDIEAIAKLVRAYQRGRTLVASERSCLVEAALLHQAAEVCSHFGAHEVALRTRSETLDDSYSYALFNGMSASSEWRVPLTA